MEKMMGVMLDCSRNAVMNVKTVKKYAEILKKMGYNTLMLYTEDTYEVNGHPYFGHLRGRFSKSELKELNDFCSNIGIELIPCIQTLAHLDAIFKWYDVYNDINDCDNILLADEEKTYKLIEDMISTLAECISSTKIHIGMDEAERVGLGKYLQKYGLKDRFDIINNHLHKVCEICKKYGKEAMVWSDMFCKLAMNEENHCSHDADREKILEKSALPDNVSLVYWDYYSTDYDHYVQLIRTNKIFGRKVYFAGGAWTWKGFAPDNGYSIQATTAALAACGDEGVDGIFLTVWGDDGGECSKFAILPALMYAAEVSRGNKDIDSIKSKFKEITGCEYDSFMLLDKLAESKKFLYNDMFMGIRDSKCSFEDSEKYKKIAEDIHNAPGKGEYEYMFARYEKFAEVLSVKAALGIRIRKAYNEKDIEEMKKITADSNRLITLLEEFHALYQEAWFIENKPHGFDVQDLRIGGLIQRIKSCTKRLEKFVSGEITEIPEMEEPVLQEQNGNDCWERLVSANKVCYF